MRLGVDVAMARECELNRAPSRTQWPPRIQAPQGEGLPNNLCNARGMTMSSATEASPLA